MSAQGPTVFGADRLVADIAADFLLDGTTVEELSVGEWRTELHGGPSRVCVGVGKGRYESAADTFNSTNGWIDVGGGQVARAILARVWTFPIWVHDLAPDGTDPAQVAEEQMRTTLALMDRTGAACARTRGGLPMLPWPSEVVNEERGEFVYGAAMKFDVTIAVPVFDFPSDTGLGGQAATSAQLDVDGTLVPPTPETSTTP